VWSIATTAMSPLEGGGGSGLEEEVMVGASCRAAVVASACRVATEACSSSRRREMAWTRALSYPILQAKPSTPRMCAQDHLFHIHELKVFIDRQMSQIKYIHYINNISKG
jgi:hypothetical protein